MPLNDRTPLPSTLVPKPRVLVVDDEPAIRMIARLHLERAGYAVEEAGTAADAVERAAGRPFAAALVDVTLPDRTGVELVTELRAVAGRTPVVLMSGRAEEDVPGHGADRYLAKPFTRDQLLAAVRAVTAETSPPGPLS